MRWPWKRPHLVTGGQEAREKAERELERIRAETPYYERLGREAKAARDRNHWGEAITRMLHDQKGRHA